LAFDAIQRHWKAQLMSAPSLLEFGGRRRTPFIQQSEASECALACIAMVAGYHGLQTDLIALRRRFALSLKGATLKQVMHVAEALGFSTRPLRGEIGHLGQMALPTILHWDMTHFVVLTKVSSGLGGKRYKIHDPARGVQTLSHDEISRHFTGVALELVKSEKFQPKTERTKLRTTQLWSKMSGIWPAFSQIIVLSVVLQLAALAAPFFLQVSIDTVFPSFDKDLLWILAIGFGGLAIITMITTWLRSLVLLRMGSALSYQIVVNLFRHLMRLPLPWFEKRHVGDVISRFGATQPIADLLTNGLIAALIDGVMAILTLVLMFAFSPRLAMLALAALAVFIALRLAFLQSFKQRSMDAITASAAESSVFIESVRGIATIKAFGDEANRQRVWQQKKANAVNAQISLARLSAGVGAGQQTVVALERIAFIYVAVSDAMASLITIGVIFAFQSYKQQFLDASMRLVEQAISYRLLDIHLGRIADIALNETEEQEETRRPTLSGARSIPAIELRNVHFRYGANEPDVLRAVNLKIESGEMLALIGPSGGGKTTLIKIMMGLFSPTDGEVLIDGRPLKSYGIASWRSQIASIAQDDSLFAGSLMDNIAMFDPEPDVNRIRQAAEEASILIEIEAMPLRFDTLVGDMGSALSGGQKQRILLARALYRNPSAIFLDEATAHLDLRSESVVLESLARKPATRVAIAHRSLSIKMASRVILIDQGKATQIDAPKPHLASFLLVDENAAAMKSG
jgi:ATP-binding cassette, subfamily B, bacterial CvaB/MchF/RaxB